MADYRKGGSDKPRLQLFQDGKPGTVFNKANFTTKAELKMIAPPPQVRLVFSHLAMQKIRALTQACDIEIGALGIVKLVHVDNIGRHVYKVFDIFVPDQDCTGTVTRITTKGLLNLLTELHEEWAKILGDDAGLDRAQEIKDHLFYWWHSHVNMGTGPSGQDEREFIEQASGHDSFFMSIGNKLGDLHCNIKMKVKELPKDFAQWEIRDVPWAKEWETMVAVKDEIHPLLVKPGESRFRIRLFEDKGAGELLIDPQIEKWAEDQVKAKVNGGGVFSKYFSRNTSSSSSTLVLPETELEVKEFYVQEDTDLEGFLIQYFGPNPQTPAPKPVYVPPVKSASVVALDGSVQALHADPIPTGKQQRETPIIIRPGEGAPRTKRHWSNLPAWVPNIFRINRLPENKGCLLIMGIWLARSIPNLIIWIFLCGIPGIAIGIGNLFEYLFYGMWVQLFGWIRRGVRNLNDNDKYRREQEYQRDLEKNRNLQDNLNRPKGTPIELPKEK